jgi:hypothetical protein
VVWAGADLQQRSIGIPKSRCRWRGCSFGAVEKATHTTLFQSLFVEMVQKLANETHQFVASL